MSSTAFLPPPREAIDKRVVAAFDILNNPAGAGVIDFEQIASSLNLSSSRLRHLFTIETGISPMQCLRLLRLERAHQLMLQSFLTVKEVTDRVGFSDVSHFVREYKRVFGETPSQTRLNHS